MNNLIAAHFNLCTETKLSMEKKSHQILKMHHNKTIDDVINYYQTLELNTTSYSKRMPTQIMQMNLGDIEGLRNEALKKNQLGQDLKSKLEKSLNISLGDVRADSIEFYNAFLFLPKNVQSIYNNFATIKHYMPEVEYCVVNSFIVKAGHQPYCIHHAADGIIDVNFNINRIHKSFHIVLQDTDYQSQPLVVFDALDNQMFSLPHAYEILVNRISQKEKLLLDNAIIAATFSENLSDLFIGKDYLISAYWNKISCQKFNNNDPRFFAYYANLKAAQGLHFDNYKLHGACSLPISSNDRVATDYRCFKNLPVDRNSKAKMVDSGVHSFIQQIPKAAQCWYKMFPNQSEEMLQMLQSLSDIESLALINMINGQNDDNQILQAHYKANHEFFQQERYNISDEVLNCFVGMYDHIQGDECIK